MRHTFEEAWISVGAVTLLSDARGRVLWEQVRQAPSGAVGELGVYRGGSAQLLGFAAPERDLHLFDTFSGHPAVLTGADDPSDQWAGKYADTSLESVRERVPHATIHIGTFPDTYEAHRWAFFHIDADLYLSVRAALASIWPDLVLGGVIVVDDYGFCPGAAQATHEWLTARSDVAAEFPEAGSAILTKTAA